MRALINSAESRGNLFWGMRFRRFGKSPQGTDSSPLSLCRFTKNYKSHTAITSLVDSARYAQNLVENSAKFAESSADSAESQNLWEKSNKKSLLKFLLLFAFAKRRIPLNHINFNPSSKVDSQNLAKNIANIFIQK